MLDGTVPKPVGLSSVCSGTMISMAEMLAWQGCEWREVGIASVHPMISDALFWTDHLVFGTCSHVTWLLVIFFFFFPVFSLPYWMFREHLRHISCAAGALFPLFWVTERFWAYKRKAPEVSVPHALSTGEFCIQVYCPVFKELII